MKHLLRANVTWSSQELIKHCKRAKLPWHRNIFYCCFLFFVLWAFIFFLSLENNVRAWIQGWFQILFFLRNSFKLWSHEMWIKVYPVQFWGVKHASHSGFNHFALEHLPFVQCWVLNGIQKSYWKKSSSTKLQWKCSKSDKWILCKIVQRKFGTGCKNFCHGNCGEA